MRIICITSLILLLAAPAFSQQLPYHSQYMFNGYLLNPAVAGSTKELPIMLTFRNQWTGFTGAPLTMTLSAHGNFKEKMGIGGALFHDQTGPTSRTGAMASYAFHVPMNKTKLSFGLSALVFQYVMDKSELTTDAPEDNAIDGAVEKKIVPEANFGILFYGDKFHIGLSVPQLIQMKVDVGYSGSMNKMTRHFFADAAYKFKVSNDFEIEPSFLFKATEAAPMQIDINAKVLYKELIWLGASYRSQESIIAMLGLKKSGFAFGYSYDITLTSIKKYSSGSHEIFLAYYLGGKVKTGKSML